MRQAVKSLILLMAATPSRLHPDTQAWLARVATNSGTVSATQTAAVDAMVSAINARGLRAGCMRFNPMVGDAAAMAVPVYNDWGATKDTVAGSPTITTDGLDTGNTATKYIDTGITPSTQSGWDSKNSHVGLWMSDGNLTSANMAICGCWSNSGTLRYGMRWQGGANIFAYFGIIAENLTRNARTQGMLSGHHLMYATAGVTNFWQNGASVIATSTNPTGGAPAATFRIGQTNNGGENCSGIFGGYHIGGALTTQNAADWSEIMTMGAMLGSRQHGWIAVGDSETSSTTWNALLQIGTYPRTTYTTSAVGGISSATCLANLITNIAANPSLKWNNAVVWIGQNDSGVGGWDGSNTIANVAAILAQFPHPHYRVINMVYGNRADEYTGQAKRATKDLVSASWVANYGVKCRNWRDILVNNGTGTGQDAVDHTNGVSCSSLHKRLAAYNITAASKAANAAITHADSTASADIVGDCWDVASVGGMTQLNGNTYQAVTRADATHMTLNVDSTAFTTYTSGGTLTLVDFIHVNPTADALLAADLATAVAGGW